MAFLDFKSSYPKRLGSNPWKPASIIFSKAIKSVNPQLIIDAATAYRQECDKLKITGTPYVMQAQRWLRNECWNDYEVKVSHEALPQVFVLQGTPQWEAWLARLGKSPPIVNFGWWFPTEWPQENGCGN